MVTVSFDCKNTKYYYIESERFKQKENVNKRNPGMKSIKNHKFTIKQKESSKPIVEQQQKCSALTFTENRRIIKSRPPLSHKHTHLAVWKGSQRSVNRLDWGAMIGKFEFSQDQPNPFARVELYEVIDPERRECCVFGCDFYAQPVQNLERQS